LGVGTGAQGKRSLTVQSWLAIRFQTLCSQVLRDKSVEAEDLKIWIEEVV